MKLIPTFVHGLIDYSIAAFLMLLPNFYFAHLGLGPSLFVRLLGVSMVLLSLATDYELGASRLIPMRAHLKIDLMISGLLLISPWILGLNHQSAGNWVPFIIFGGLGLVVTSLTSLRVSRYPIWPA